ncbi:hypothetical protein AYO22_05124 [Fonsecaea multimorphosa]|nr:hypothetical protein AYO22_05124 [Fonsecaea multimorphosa]
MAMNCTSSPAVTTPPSGPTNPSPHSPDTVASTHESHTGAIAGGVVGGVLGLASLVLVVFLFWRRQRRRRARTNQTSTATEKAQLHADDVKPDRKELPGTEGSQDLLQKKPTEVAEMAANEEVVARDKLRELPSNETPSHEMETTENEMAALDRMARLTGSTQATTLVSSRSKTDDTPEA